MTQPPRIPRLLDKVAHFFAVLKLLRFQLLLVLAGIALAFVDAIHDAWYAAADQRGFRLVLSLGGITVAALAAATANWFTARLLLRFGLPNSPGIVNVDTPGSLWATAQLPRLLGSAVLVIIGATALVLGILWKVPTLWIYGAINLGIAVLFYWLLVKRREWQGKASVAGELKESQDKKLDATLGTLWNALSHKQRLIGGALYIIAIAFIVMGIFFPDLIVAMGSYVNVVGVVLLGALLMTPVGALLAYLSNYSRIPLFTLLLIYVLGISLFNENHDVRLCAQQPCMPAGARAGVNLEAYAERWIAASKPNADGSLPVLIVATEGGGVRAAYWTAAVLEYLDRLTMRSGASRSFSQSVLAISGVSGGSVGAMIHAARTQPGEPCATIDDAFREDALAPTVATLLFTDLPQRFLPVSLGADRAATLETQWERVFCRMNLPFDALSPPDGALRRPLLLLNSTAVGSGRRVVVSSLNYASQHAFAEDFPEALDGARILGTTALPGSAAALTSARFPLVSPAGVAHPQDGGGVVRLVDGGYFENSGSATARDVLAVLRRLRPRHPQLDIGILFIRNTPKQAITVPDARACTADFDPKFVESRHLPAPESGSPVRAFFNSWSKSSDDVRQALRTDLTVNGGSAPHVFEIALYDLPGGQCSGPTPHLPLSWLLSGRSVDAMRSQLDQQFQPPGSPPDRAPTWALKHNDEEVRKLLQFLAGPQ